MFLYNLFYSFGFGHSSVSVFFCFFFFLSSFSGKTTAVADAGLSLGLTLGKALFHHKGGSRLGGMDSEVSRSSGQPRCYFRAQEDS